MKSAARFYICIFGTVYIKCILIFCTVFYVFYLWSCVFLSLSAGRQPTWAGSTVPPSQHLLPARHCWLFHRVYFANFIFCQESSPFLCCKSTFAPRLPVPVWSVPTTWYLMSLEQGLADDSNYRFRWLLLKTFLRIYMPTREERICKSCNTLVSFLPKVNRPSRLNFYLARWQ